MSEIDTTELRERFRGRDACNTTLLYRVLDRLDELQAENEQLRQSVAQGGDRTLRCAFCGEAYPPGTPATQHQLLTEHVLVCAKHPMREVVAEKLKAMDALRETVQELAAVRRENDRLNAELRIAQGDDGDE